jgi:gag-polyprotein putative aspartyl protease
MCVCMRKSATPSGRRYRRSSLIDESPEPMKTTLCAAALGLILTTPAEAGHLICHLWDTAKPLNWKTYNLTDNGDGTYTRMNGTIWKTGHGSTGEKWLVDSSNHGWGLQFDPGSTQTLDGVTYDRVLEQIGMNVIAHGDCVSTIDTHPISNDSVDITTTDEWRSINLDVYLGSFTLPTRFLLDTGATGITVAEAIANDLIAKGEAHEVGKGQYTLADGSRHMEREIVIGTLILGQHTLHNVIAGVASEATEMLLGMSVLNQIGPFKIDPVNRKMIFG